MNLATRLILHRCLNSDHRLSILFPFNASINQHLISKLKIRSWKMYLLDKYCYFVFEEGATKLQNMHQYLYSREKKLKQPIAYIFSRGALETLHLKENFDMLLSSYSQQVYIVSVPFVTRVQKMQQVYKTVGRF